LNRVPYGSRNPGHVPHLRTRRTGPCCAPTN
jgi:hypothetical protein